MHPQGTFFVTGGEDGLVRLYKVEEDGNPSFETYLTRFGNPPGVRAIAFGPLGDMVACGGDEGVIRVVGLGEGSPVLASLGEASSTTLGSVVSLAFDPEGEFIAAIHQEGTLNVWNWRLGKSVYSRRRACPKSAPNPTLGATATQAAGGGAYVAKAQWTTDGGTYLLAPGSDDTIQFYPRLEWEPTMADTIELGAPLSGPATAICLSPNGHYLAVGDRKGATAIYNMITRKLIAQLPAPESANGMATVGLAWRPLNGARELSVMHASGHVSVWSACIPAGEIGPCEAVPEEDGALAREGENDAAGHGDGDDGSMGGFVEEDGPVPEGGRRGRKSGRSRMGPIRASDVDPKFLEAIVNREPVQQAAIQPGATPVNPINGRRFLAYNPEGLIRSKEEDGYTLIEVIFHDTVKHPYRVPIYRDMRGIEMGTLGDRGALYAAPPKKISKARDPEGLAEEQGGDLPGCISFQPFDAWANNTAWELNLAKGETCLALASGKTFHAAATSKGVLRVFTLSGAQTAVMSLPGNVIGMAAQGHRLAVIYHQGAARLDGTQTLGYLLLDCLEGRRLQAGSVAISPGAQLQWLGFSLSGLLSTCDSTGVVRSLSQDFGGSWVPVFDFANITRGQEGYWIVGLTEDRVQCIVVERKTDVPQVLQPLTHEPHPLAIPVLQSTAPGDDKIVLFEEQLMRAQMHLSDREWCEGNGITTEGVAIAKPSGQWQLDCDRMLLRIINEDMKRDRCSRALELCSQLHSTDLLEKTLMLASTTGRTALMERITALVEARRVLEAGGDPDTPTLGAHVTEGSESDGERPDMRQIKADLPGFRKGIRAEPAPLPTSNPLKRTATTVSLKTGPKANKFARGK